MSKGSAMIVSPFLKQLYVALSPIIAAFSAGGAVSYPTVLLEQLKKKDSPITVDFETASWMGAIHGITSIPSIFMPAVMQRRGRKYVLVLTISVITIGWVIAYFAADAWMLLLAESLHGLGTSSLLTVNCFIITEMVSPKFRDIFMQILYITQTIGMATDGLLVQYYHWRTISLIMLLPTVLSLIIALTISESPYWLAYKGNVSKCEENFVRLRGSDAKSKKELSELIRKPVEDGNSFCVKSLTHFWKKLTSRDFYLPAAHVCVLQFLIHGSGSVTTLIYSITILKNVTNNDKISSYGGLITNILLCLGLCAAIALDKYFKKKSILLGSVVCAILFLIAGSAFSYCQSVGVWPKESLAGLYCLTGVVLFGSVGIMGLTFTIAAVLMPVKHRGLGGALMLINTGLFHTVALKSAPYMFTFLNMWGTFLVYASISALCGLFIWKHVPETKGRSLPEIENYYNFGSFSHVCDRDVDSNLTKLFVSDGEK